MKMRSVMLISLLGMGLASAAIAQNQSVRINVSKTQKKNLQTTSSSGYSRTQSGTETVMYSIEVINRSAGALDNLKVKWAVLVRTYGTDRLVEGERGTDLAFGQKLAFETDPIDMSVTKHEYSDGYRSRYGAEVIGYLVQVFAGGKLIGQEGLPNDAIQRIEGLRAKPDQKRHKF